MSSMPCLEAAARRRARRVGVLLAFGAALTSLPATAQVTLATAVSKVETTLDADGRSRRELVPAEAVVPGEELRYTITFENTGGVPVDAGRIVVTNPIPEGTRYVPGSAGGEGTSVEYSTDGESFGPGEPAAAGPGPDGGAAGGEVRSIRWTYQEELAPGEASEVFFHVRMQ